MRFDIQSELVSKATALAGVEKRERVAIDNLIGRTNNKLRIIEYAITIILLAMGACAIFDYATGYFQTYSAWKFVLAVGGLLGLYHLIAHTLQKPVYGVSNALNGLGRFLFNRSLHNAGLHDRFDVDKEAEFATGRMKRQQVELDHQPGRLV